MLKPGITIKVQIASDPAHRPNLWMHSRYKSCLINELIVSSVGQTLRVDNSKYQPMQEF